ncbi:TetR family transcriptional regulator [Mesorhizobium sp. SARCC-RB16n]|uniref:TetR/AcrR family transcriptional regulator n=1 Tax=Mesorhizobium sp. SARCC-RB16n TaxID=2116687 RepID=UPI00122F0181|nr:TetR family transcriptional regulator [Mesorhizobium sp. SARCC-RB16n]KAA3448079.1 TetR family transcriptional regulator [Mesorhizobium sp. SARCC-RB16n]
MNRPDRTRTDPDEMRARILAVADEQFRRLGYHKTSVADIASELGMSTANVYRFFPSKGAIIESICGRVVNEVAEIAFAIARTSAPASEKLDQLLTAVHQHSKTTLVKEKRMHDMIVAAVQEKRAIIKAHTERIVAILQAIIREGVEDGEFQVENPAEAACAVKTAFTPFFHPILIEHCLQHGEDNEAGLREQIRFILKALGKSD